MQVSFRPFNATNSSKKITLKKLGRELKFFGGLRQTNHHQEVMGSNCGAIIFECKRTWI
jgi:hypothetical protein